ncbi:MAG: aspartate-semialdehyde dehydrogenase [Candidatus Paceibacterota bacterium]
MREPITREMQLMLEGYGLTTAEILYHIPDHRDLLQTFIWQDYDLAPRFPRLHGFLDFWTAKLDGPLHSIKVAHRHLIAASEWKRTDCELRFH